MGIMREIKFRAWDGGQMHPSVAINTDGSWYDENGFPKRGKVEIMQYTNLKDKNGKEIYEGDILKGTDSTDTLESVSWGEAEWLSGRLALNSSLFSKEGDAEFIEIIGNIYSNPELLKS